MTEIPEHLLKRSRERRAALGLPTDGGEATAGRRRRRGGERLGPGGRRPVEPGRRRPRPRRPGGPPAAAAGGTAAPAGSALRRRGQAPRKKIPFWAMPVARPAAALGAASTPWALKPPEKVVAGPLGEGKTVFATCASCHGEHRRGRRRPPAQQRRGPEDVPDSSRTRRRSSTRAARPYAGKIYGDPNRPGGPHQGGSFNGSFMPQQGAKYGGALTDAEIIAVVCHERFTTRAAPTRSTRSTCRSSPTGARRGARSSKRSAPATTTLDEEGIEHDARRPEQPVPSTRSLRRPRRRRRPGRRGGRYWLARPATTSPSSSARRFPARRPAATA